ncbi:two-component system sensor histidine kinase NtrB [Dissulfurispira sp.]|uniref:two-component system sensor histidine kinase NtrB n=1 Tax=Dissulfurispira sp. TaxID=2817609 RepID=UPI002FDAFA76
MHDTYLRGNHIYLIAILVFATVITLISTFLTYKNSKKAAEDSLNLQALGIAVSLETSLNNSDELRKQKNIFKEIITEGRWEGIAFIALYDKNGTIILHSNENLIGRQARDRNLKKVIDTGTPSHTYITLGTDERVFILDFPVHIRNSERILRLALHTNPVEGIVRQARLHVLGMFFIIALLWVVGYFFVRASRHSDELRMKMAERERFAVIGEMASVLAHEIRNPLGSIKGFAQYLKEQNTDNRIQGADSLDIIVSESKRLEALTEDLLMYAKPMEVKPGEFDVGDLTDEIVRTINQSMGDSKKVNIKVSVPSGLKIKSDRDKLKQVLTNILQNAVDAGSRVIDIKAEFMNDKTTIWISDDGCGMSQETKENVFKPFFTTKTKGTGLGLAIVDKLTKAIGGEIELESEPQKGTVFKIVIPKNFI